MSFSTTGTATACCIGLPGRTAVTDSIVRRNSQVCTPLRAKACLRLARTTGIPADLSPRGHVKRARYATTALSLVLALYVFEWSHELWAPSSS